MKNRAAILIVVVVGIAVVLLEIAAWTTPYWSDREPSFTPLPKSGRYDTATIP
jgi:hypothetical protein